MLYAPLVPGDREGRPYISWRNIGLGNVGATLAVARLMDNSQTLHMKETPFFNGEVWLWYWRMFYLIMTLLASYANG